MRTKLLSLLVLLSFLRSCQSRGKTTARPQGCEDPKLCFQGTTRNVVKSLINITDRMRAALPDHMPGHKLLKKFPKKKNLTVISFILELYSKYVFNNNENVFNKLNNSQKFMDEFQTLQNDVNHCEERFCDACPQKCKISKNLKKLKKKFMKLDRAGVHKAVWEFKNVLLMMAGM